MNHKTFFLFLMILGTLLSIASCKTTGLSKKQQIKQFEKMEWLIGCWQNQSPEMTLTETWVKEMDTVFTAISIFTTETDTLYLENIRLAPSKINISYSITSKNNGRKENLTYILRKNQRGILVFDDQGNLEQSRITYRKKSKETILLQLEGTEGNEVTKEFYQLSKVK